LIVVLTSSSDIMEKASAVFSTEIATVISRKDCTRGYDDRINDIDGHWQTTTWLYVAYVAFSLTTRINI